MTSPAHPERAEPGPVEPAQRDPAARVIERDRNPGSSACGRLPVYPRGAWRGDTRPPTRP